MPGSIFDNAVGLDGAEMARLAGAGAESNNPLFNVGRFLSRPLYAVTSALSGEFGDAAENLIQMGLDLPTGGFLNRNWSLANLFSDTGDITTQEERPEVSDLTRRLGMGAPSSTLGRLALDVGGGMLLDPLTYLTLGASALAKGSLTILERTAASAKLAGQLSRTNKGLRALEAAEDLVRSTRRTDIAADTLRAFRGGGVDLAMARNRAVRGLAAEEVFRRHAGLGDDLLRISGHVDQTDVMNAGIKALEDASLVERHGQWKFMGQGIPGSESFRLRDLTAPWLANRALGAFEKTKPAADLIEAVVGTAWTNIKGTLFDKTLLGNMPEGVKHLARRLAHGQERGVTEASDAIRKLYGKRTPEELVTMGKALDEAGDDYMRFLENPEEFAAQFADRFDPRTLPEGWDEERLRRAILGTDTRVPKVGAPRQIAIVRNAAKGKLNPDKLREFLDKELAETLHQALPDADIGEVLGAMREYRGDMERIQLELVRLGVWKGVKSKPFYLPHQASAQLAELMAAVPGNKLLKDDLRAVIAAFKAGKFSPEAAQVARKDVFTKARRHETAAAFQEALDELGLKHGIEAGVETVEHNLAQLHHRRLLAHNQTKYRTEFYNEARKRMRLDEDPNVARYLNSQLAPITSRGKIMTILGGGTWNIPMARMSPRLMEAAKANGWKVKDGLVSVPFPGINSVYKPFLTTHPINAGFHFRNTLGSFIMGFTDPDIGWKGIHGLLDAMAEYPLIRALGLRDSSEVSQMLKAMKGDEVAMAGLKGKKIGNYAAEEVVGHLKGFLGKRISPADLMEEIADPLLDTAKGGAFARYQRVGEEWAGRTEAAFRANAYLALLKKGVPPTEAVTRVGRVFVDYKINSATERALRDVFPFVRFAFGSAAWLKAYAKNPKLVTPLARLQQSTQGEGAILPESIRGGLAIPLGEDEGGATTYLSSLGLPQEAAFNVLDAVTNFQGVRRSGLGMLHPLLKAPLEQATNRNFFYGDEAGQFRSAPLHRRMLGFGVDEFETPWGIRREVSGGYNDFVGATPLSRVSRYADILADERKGTGEKAMRLLTGLRTVSVDQKRAARKALAKRAEREVDRGRLYKIPAFGVRKLPGGKTPEDLQKLLDALRQTGGRRANRGGSIFD